MDTNRIDESQVKAGLERLAGNTAETSDSYGNRYYWYMLPAPCAITEAARILHDGAARLAMITAWKPEQKQPGHNICYEFVLGGIVHSCTVKLDEEHDSVPSITPIFANADWHEREMMELSGIKVSGHPDPKRLFLDETLDKGVLNQIVPLSVVMNGASSSDLWERIMSAKGV